MDDTNIGQRMRATTRFLIGGLVFVGLLGVAAAFFLSQNTTKLAQSGDVVLLGAAIQEDVLEASLAALAYRNRATSAFAGEVSANIDEVQGDTATLAALLGTSSESTQDAIELSQVAAAYLSEFETATQQQSIVASKAQELASTGLSIRTAIAEIVDHAYASGSGLAGTYAGRMQESLLLAWLYADRYIRTSDDTYLSTSREYIAATRARLGELVPNLRDPSLWSKGPELGSNVDMFEAILNDLVTAITARDSHFDQIDRIGATAVAASERIVDRAIEEQQSRAATSTTLKLATLAAIIIVSGIAAVFALRMASQNVSKIDAGIDTILGMTSALADGNLSVEIVGKEHDHELGRMAQSLQVLKDNSLERIELERASQEREADIRKERAAEEERLRKQREATERKADEDRKKMLVDLRNSIGTVVDAAAAGDFTGRIQTNFADVEVQQMADGVNTLVATVETGINETARALALLSAGDLSQRMTGDFQGTFLELRDNVNSTVETLANLVRRISHQCDAVTANADTMRSDAGDLSRRAEQQAASLEETAAAMAEISATATSSADNATAASKTAREASDKVDEAGHVMETAIQSMDDIKTASDSISEIVTVIDSIAFQTNLLALNASVEAARAGSAGKGFAVVASEVRSLAQRAGDASRDIRTLIDQSSAEVEKGASFVGRTSETLEGVVARVRDLATTMPELTAASKEQATGVPEINSALTQIAQTTQANATLADQRR